jgi:hypothetical protein
MADLEIAVLRIRDTEVKCGSGSGLNIPDHFSESLQTVFWIKMLTVFNADPGSFSHWIRDGKIWIRDKHLGSATLRYFKMV